MDLVLEEDNWNLMQDIFTVCVKLANSHIPIYKDSIRQTDISFKKDPMFSLFLNPSCDLLDSSKEIFPKYCDLNATQFYLNLQLHGPNINTLSAFERIEWILSVSQHLKICPLHFLSEFSRGYIQTNLKEGPNISLLVACSNTSKSSEKVKEIISNANIYLMNWSIHQKYPISDSTTVLHRRRRQLPLENFNSANVKNEMMSEMISLPIKEITPTPITENSMLTSTMVFISSTMEVPTMFTMTLSPSPESLTDLHFTELTANVGESSDLVFELSSLFDTASTESLYIMSSTVIVKPTLSTMDSGMNLATISTAKYIIDSMISTIQMISLSRSYDTAFPETETIDFIPTLSLLSDSLPTISPYTPTESTSSEIFLISPSIFISTALQAQSSILSDSIDLTDLEFTIMPTQSITLSDSFEAILSTPTFSVEKTEGLVSIESTAFTDAESTILQSIAVTQSQLLRDFTTTFIEMQTIVMGPSSSIPRDLMDFTSLVFTDLESSFLPTDFFTVTQSTISSDVSNLFSKSTAMMTDLDIPTESFEMSDFMISNPMSSSLIASSTVLQTTVDISLQLPSTILPTITSLFLPDLLSMTLDSVAPTNSEFITSEGIGIDITTTMLTDITETYALDFQSTILIDPTPVVTQVVTSSQFNFDSDIITIEMKTIDVTFHSSVVSNFVQPSMMLAPSIPPPPPPPPPPPDMTSVVESSTDMTITINSDIIATRTASVEELSASEDFTAFISPPFITVDMNSVVETSADLMITSIDEMAFSDIIDTQTLSELSASGDFTASMTSPFIAVDMTSSTITIIDDTTHIFSDIFVTETAPVDKLSTSEDFSASVTQTISNSEFEGGIEMQSSIFSSLTSTAMEFDNRFTSIIFEVTSTNALSSENSFEDPVTTLLIFNSVFITPISSLGKSFETSFVVQSIEITEVFMQQTTSLDFTESEQTSSDLVIETSVLPGAVSETDFIMFTSMIRSFFPTNTPMVLSQSSIQSSYPMSILNSISTFDFALHSTSSFDLNVQTSSIDLDIETTGSLSTSPSVSILISSSLIPNSALTSGSIFFTPSPKEIVISSSKYTFPSSEISLESTFVSLKSSRDVSSISTTSIVAEPTPIFGPLLVNPLGVLVVDEGQPFQFDLPTTTFLSQGGSFDTFHITLYNGTNGESLLPTSWVHIQNNMIEGLALVTETNDGDITDHKFILRAANENGFSANDTFVLRIIPQTSVENFIRVFIDGNFRDFSYNLSERLELAKALNGPSQKNEIFTQQFSNGSIAVLYSNLTIDQLSCSEYLRWFETIYSKNNYTTFFFEQLKPFQPIGVAESIGPCNDQQKQLTIVSIDPSVALNSQETVTIFVLLAAGSLLCGLFLILTFLCLCCSLKLRRPEQKSFESRESFLNREPFIFPGEIEAIPYRSRNTFFLRKGNGYMTLLHQDDEEVVLNHEDNIYDEELICIFPQATVNDPPPTYKFSPQCLEKV